MVAQLSSATRKRYRGVFHRFTDWFVSVEPGVPQLDDLHPDHTGRLSELAPGD